jgi:hypothetical protein
MKPRFTPGPWRIYETPFHVKIVGPEKDPNEHAAVCLVGDRSPVMTNARLIAAAPEMLEALRLAVEFIESQELNGWIYLSDCKAAIRKATGGEE